jgi:small subunit ribosomal protein S8
MSLSDPIADMLTRIRNGQMARLVNVEVPHSKIKESILKVMIDEGFISSYDVVEDRTNISTIHVKLRYLRNKGVINKIQRVSTPGSRKSMSAEILSKTKFYNGLGISILSTSKGVVSDREARRQNIGGEVICNIY